MVLNRLQKPEKGVITMPDLNDFYAFKMSGGSSGGGSSDDGCLQKILMAVMIMGLIGLLGRCGG